MAFSLVASVLAPAASGQSQTSWYVNDNPSLNGPSRYWWAGDAGKGYGSNNYVYTYGTAGESNAGNWARWSMGKRVGRQEIQAYVPNTRATATVLYRIDIGGTQHTKRVAQRDAYGWTSLGAYDADGDTVTITLRDNEASQHWSRHGESKSSIGVDAIRMRCTSRCSTAPAATPAPVPTQAPQIDEPSQPRNLRVSADEDSATVSWNPPSNNGGAAITGYRADLYRGSTRVDRKNLSASQRSTAFSGLSADTAYQIRVSAENSAGRGTRATASFRTDAARRPQVSPPGAPRIVGFVNGTDTVGVVWNPPSDNGGAPITGYTIELYLNNRRIDTKTVGAGTRETEFKGLSADTAYQVRITARNTAGTSNPRTATARTGAATSAPSAPRSLRVSADEDSATVSWSAPSDDGGAAISGYRADLYRGSTRVERKSLPASQRSTAFTGLNADTAYQIRISAENSAGRSASAAAGFRTDAAPQRQAARSVTIALAADRAGCSDTSKPCRWLSASYSGFSPGSYRVRCYWSTSRSSLGSQFASFTTSRISGTDTTLCWFNGTPGRYLTAVADGVQSNTVQFTGTPPAPQATAPEAPRIVGFVNGPDTVGVVWNPPSDNGGAPITGYTIDLYHNNRRIDTKTVSANTRETEFKNLSADTAYQVRITARNSAGTSNPTVANARTGTATRAPTAPRNLRVTASENSATASWNPPSDDGGASVSGYRADLYRGSTRVDRKNLSASQRSTTFTGLSADTAYQIRVTAQNSAGRSASAAASFRTHAARQPQATAPGAPRIVGFVNDTDTVGVVWNPPSDNGGAPITGYTIDLYHNNRRINTKTLGPQARETEFKNLSADTAYQVRITAHNTAGTSTPRTANARTNPATRAPSTPRNLRVTPGEDSATVSWSPPSDNGGAAISGYRADLYRGSTRVDRKSLSASQRSTTFTGLSADTAYQVLVSARNNQGLSTPTAADFTTDAPEDTRSVTITLGADRANCQDTSKPCRWLSASFSGFTPGHHNAHCYYSTTPTSLGTRSWSGTVDTTTGNDPTLCWLNATPGLHLTAIIGGVQSNTIQLAGTAPTAPGAPRNVKAVPVNTNRIKVTWNPPTNSGSSPITHYTVNFSRPSSSFSQTARVNAFASTTYTYTYPNNLRHNTLYTIKVTAVNDTDTPGPTVTIRASTVEEFIFAFDAIEVDPPPYTGTISKPISYRKGSWQKYNDDCGFWRCGSHYYLGAGSDLSATWNMGDLQGVFLFSWKNPKDKISHLTGRPIWKIYEKRTGTNNWRLVKKFTPNPQNNGERDVWWGFPDYRLELDGQVMITVANGKPYGSLGLRYVRLRFIDVLPELKPAAIELCKIGVEKALKVFASTALAIPAAVLVVTLAPVVAKVITAKTISALKALSKSISTKGLSLLTEAAPYVMKGISSKVNNISFRVGQVIGGSDWDETDSIFAAMRKIKDYVVNWAGNIFENAVDSYSYGCREFRAGKEYLNITRGYGSFADDLAKVYGRRR